MESIIPRYFDAPGSSFFLFGPRGTGKSTFLKASFPDAIYIDLLKPDLQRKYQAKPEALIELVNAHPSESTYIVDEIQRVPALLSAIHSLIEDNKKLQFIMTGSSARKIRESGINLLAGRALLRTMHPFMLSELGNSSSFLEALDTGLLPIIATADNPADTLNTYISLYIREEVQYEGLTRNIGNFSRFLEVISFSHASLINVSNIARECEVERKVVENYISILEDILIGSKLTVFSKRARRTLVSHPKFYLFDTGVFKALRPKGPLDNPHEIGGAALEGLVYQHLRAWNDYRGKPFEIYFWRSKGGVEVDFILYGATGIHAIEVNNSARIRPGDLRPLREFKKDYPKSQVLLLYRGKERIERDEVLCVPCEEYLRTLIPGNVLPLM
jgi:predicted AAA+ superfamily ATPase